MPRRTAGYTLLPVVLAMSLVAAIAFLINRDNGMNAGMAATGDDAERARLAAEAGLQAANYAVQQQGCAGGFPTSAAPVTNANFAGAAYSAYASQAAAPAPPLTIALSSTGSYNGSSVTLARSTVYVYQSPRQSYTLQPGPATGKDAYLDNKFPDRNYGKATSMKIDEDTYAPLLQFNFTAFPAGSRVIPWYDGAQLQPGARLGLYVSNTNDASSETVSAYLLTRSWVMGTMNGSGMAPNGATWNTYDGDNSWATPGGDYAATPLSSVPVAGASGWAGWLNWDITNAVAAWMSGAYVNNGVLIYPAGTGIKNMTITSANNTNSPEQRPRVVLNYLLPCGAAPPA